MFYRIFDDRLNGKCRNMGELSIAIIDNYNHFLFLADEKKFTPKRDYLKKLWTVGIY